MFSWNGRLATLINADWDEEQADADLSSFVKAWEYVYCFEPLEIQVTLQTLGNPKPWRYRSAVQIAHSI